MRPLVQLPMTTWSMVTSARSAAAAALLGRCGLLTVSGTAEASISRTRAYSASASLAKTVPAVRARLPSGRLCRYCVVFSSKPTMPFLPPASMAMLHIVKRSSMDSASMASPANSIAWYRAPSTPIRPMVCRIRSLPVTQGCGRPE